MAELLRKRKASDSMVMDSKRLCGNNPLTADLDEVSDDEYHEEENDFSDDGKEAETPATPLSPARKKFPSELKHLKCTWEGCTKSFNRPIRLQNHLKTHTNERTFVCQHEDCDKAYFEAKHLQAHIKGSHTHERKHQCEWEGCGKSFLTATRLRRHIATHEGHERFRCRDYPPCNQTFRKHQTLQRHIRSDHLELAPYPCKFADPVTNQPCKAGFDGASGLRRHEEIVHGAPQFFCANCVIPFAYNPDGSPMHPGFSTNLQLQSHIRKEHTNSVCIFCDKKCSNERQLQIHIESQHSGSTLEERKSIFCTHPGCDKTFTKKSNLTIHIRTIHMGERFVCGEFDTSTSNGLESFDPDAGCGMDFTSKAYLEDHIRVTHLGLTSTAMQKRARIKIERQDDLASSIDDEDADNTYEPRSRKSKRKAKYSVLQKMTGNRSMPSAPSLDFEPDIDPCLVPQSMNHNEQPFSISEPNNNFDEIIASGTNTSWPPSTPTLDATAFPDDATLTEPFDNVDWELEQQAMRGEPFWVGADHGFDVTNYDLLWSQEEREMRRLIGDGGNER